MLKKLLFASMLLLLFACTEDPQISKSSQRQNATPTGVSTPAPSIASQTTAASEHSLVFFLDPNGGPCRMQNSILQGMEGELKGKVNVRYVQTTVPDDRQYFYAYGIRGLPSLLLADASGKELKRLPPGVNPAEKVRELLQTIPN